jgi:putative flippase GtrA
MTYRAQIKFLTLGFLNTLIGLAIIYYLMILEFNNFLSNIISYTIVNFIGFFLNKKWTFEFKNKSNLKIVGKYIISIFIAYLTNILTLLILLEFFHINKWLSQFLAVIPYSLVLFLLLKYFTFHKKY